MEVDKDVVAYIAREENDADQHHQSLIHRVDSAQIELAGWVLYQSELKLQKQKKERRPVVNSALKVEDPENCEQVENEIDLVEPVVEQCS